MAEERGASPTEGALLISYASAASAWHRAFTFRQNGRL